MPRRNDLEHRALQKVIDKGLKGILQSELWRELKANSRDGSRISLKLESKNLIRRERELSNGRWTYRLFVKRKPLKIDSILNIPCITCIDISKCETRGEVSPITCEKLTLWLLTLVDYGESLTIS